MSEVLFEPLPAHKPDLAGVLCDAVSAADAERTLDEGMTAGLRTVGEAARLSYVAVALLDRRSEHFEYRHEWAGEAEAIGVERAVAQRYVAQSMLRLQRLEMIERRTVLIAPFAAHGKLAGVAIAARHDGVPWSDVEKHVIRLAADVLIARLTIHATQRDLRIRDKQLKLVLSATNDAVYQWRVGSDEVLWNDAVLALTRETAEGFESSRAAWSARIVEEDAERVRASLDAALRGDAPFWSEEYRIRRRDAAIIRISDRATIVRDDARRGLTLIGAVADVTEARRAEEQYRQLIDQAYDMIVAIDEHGGITSLNRAFEIMTGWDRAVWIGRDIADLLDPADTIAARETLRHLRQAPHAITRELRLLTRRGETLELDVTISPVMEHGVCAGMSWIGRDVTHRNRAQREYVEMANRVRLLLESTFEGIVAVDAHGDCHLVNASACRILGCTPEELLGRNFHDIVHPRHESEEWAHANTLCPLGGLTELRIATALSEETFSRYDGTTIPVQFAGAPVDAAPLRGVVVTFSDATERKLLQNELERAHRMAGLGHVAATIAHEFNNVLMGIQPFVDLLQRRVGDNAEMTEPLDRITASVRRGKKIALEMLRFSRPVHVELVPTDLHVWLPELAGAARALLGDSYDVALDVANEPLVIRADRELLHQAFINLVTNARDAMPSGGSLRISVQRHTTEIAGLIPSDRFVRIAIRDSGEGMTAETMKHIFEPLFTTKNGRGTGLGLAFVHQIVSAHGGYVFAESEIGIGSAFSIYLSLIDEVVGQEILPLPVPAQSILSACRVLLIEDDDAIAAGVMAMLEMEGIPSAVVTRGAEAVAAAERFTPAVVLLDVGLPDVDGREVFRALRARWPELPVIFSTGHADDGIAAAGDGVRLLRKPYETSELLRCIHNLIARTDDEIHDAV